MLLSISDLLGAHTQDYLVRRAQPQKQLLANTHLVVFTNSGSKYDAARKWGLPAVSKRWLVDCARQSRRLPEADYDVDLEATGAVAARESRTNVTSPDASNCSNTSSSSKKSSKDTKTPAAASPRNAARTQDVDAEMKPTSAIVTPRIKVSCSQS